MSLPPEYLPVKILYLFGLPQSFLARPPAPLPVRTAAVDGALMGAVALKELLAAVATASPERFAPGTDYLVYVPDVSEPDLPLVGYGLYLKVVEQESLPLVAGQVCQRLHALLGSGGHTLEVKVEFHAAQSVAEASPGPVPAPTPALAPAPQMLGYPASTPFALPRKRQRYYQPSQPAKAARTQSLPLFTPPMPPNPTIAQQISIADRIREDMDEGAVQLAPELTPVDGDPSPSPERQTCGNCGVTDSSKWTREADRVVCKMCHDYREKRGVPRPKKTIMEYYRRKRWEDKKERRAQESSLPAVKSGELKSDEPSLKSDDAPELMFDATLESLMTDLDMPQLAAKANTTVIFDDKENAWMDSIFEEVGTNPGPTPSDTPKDKTPGVVVMGPGTFRTMPSSPYTDDMQP